MIISSMIVISLASLQSPPPTLAIYDQNIQLNRIEYKIDTDIPSVVSWKELSKQLGLELPTNRIQQDASPEILQAFREINLPQENGLRLLRIAKKILSEANYPCNSVIPVIARDTEEDVSYLTLRLHVKADMAKAFELDDDLTRGLISSFSRLPVRLSFTVSENEDDEV